jgi:hypothetical protein
MIIALSYGWMWTNYDWKAFKKLSTLLEEKRGKSYAEVFGYVNVCVASSQMSYRRPHWGDTRVHASGSKLNLIRFPSRLLFAALLLQSRLPYCMSIPITASVTDPTFKGDCVQAICYTVLNQAITIKLICNRA